MDGTIINSIASAERIWGDWARRQGLDVEKFMPTMHGARGIDTIRNLNLPGVDPATESALIEKAEIADVDGVVAIHLDEQMLPVRSYRGELVAGELGELALQLSGFSLCVERWHRL